MIAPSPTSLRLPAWATKLLRRLAALEDGRYLVILSKGADSADWSVTRMGKIETLEQ